MMSQHLRRSRDAHQPAYQAPDEHSSDEHLQAAAAQLRYSQKDARTAATAITTYVPLVALRPVRPSRKMNTRSAANPIGLTALEEPAEPPGRLGVITVQDNSADSLATEQEDRLLNCCEGCAAVSSH